MSRRQVPVRSDRLRTPWSALLALVLLLLAQPAAAALVVGVEANPDPVRPGEPVEVRVTVSNDGVSALSDVEVSLLLPADVDDFNERLATLASLRTSAACSGGISSSVCEPGETLIWDLGTLDGGAGLTVAVPMVVTSGTANGTSVSFEATADATAVSAVVASRAVTVEDAPAYELSLDESADPVEAGAELTYALTFASPAVGSSPSATLTFDVPAGTSFVAASDGGSESGGVVTWALGSLEQGQSGVRRVTVAVGGGAVDGTQLVALAEISDVGVPAGEAFANALTRVETGAPLGLAVEVNPDPVRPGETAATELTVTNFDTVSRSVELELRMPGETDTYSEPLATFSGTSGFGGDSCWVGTSSGTCQPNERIYWTLTVPAGGGLTVSVPPVIAAATVAGSVVPFLASATDLSNGDQATARRSVVAESAPAYELALADGADPVASGASLTYALTYAVATATPTPAATLRFEVPADTSFASASDGGSESGGVVTWPLGSLVQGDSGVRRVSVTVDGGAPDGTLLAAEARIDDVGSPPGEARANAVTRLETGAVLAVAVEVHADPLRPGETAATEVTVTNADAVARDVELELRFPDEIENFSEALTTFSGTSGIGGSSCWALISAGSCYARERLVVPLTLPAGGGLTLSVPPVVAAATPDGSLVPFVATVTDLTNGDQATARRSVAAQATPTYELFVADSADPAEPGAELAYALRYAAVEAGSSPATALRFEVPDDTTFVSASDGGSESGGIVSWPLGSLAQGESGMRRVTVLASGALADGALLAAEARIEDTGVPFGVARAGSVTRLETAPVLDVAVEANPDPARPGERLEALLTVSNRDVAARTVELELRFPDEIENFTEVLATFAGTSGIGGSSCWALISASSCYARERLVWTLTVPAGGGVSVSAPPAVDAGAAAGSILPFVATVTDRTNGDQATGRRSVVARADPLFELSIDDGADPVAAGGSLTYVVSFGQVEVGPASATLTATVPAGTSFLSASDGGSESGGLVTWALATLDAGEEGSRSFTVSVGGGLPDGSVLESDARVASAAGEARASAATRVEAAGPLDLSLAVTPARILPGEALDAAVTVENTGGVALTNVTVELRLPKEIVAFNESQLPSSGDLTTASCWTGTSSSFCDGWERVVWSFASLAPGATLDLGAAPTLLSGDARPSNGTVIPVQVVATADGLSAASERAAVRVGDGDGVPDPSDNCLLTFNPVQVDTNGDGCGNICDADLTNDGLVGIPDFVLFGPEFGAPAPPSDPDADFTGDGAVGVPDFSVLGVLFGKEAGPGEDPSDRNCNGIPDVGE